MTPEGRNPALGPKDYCYPERSSCLVSDARSGKGMIGLLSSLKQGGQCGWFMALMGLGLSRNRANFLVPVMGPKPSQLVYSYFYSKEGVLKFTQRPENEPVNSSSERCRVLGEKNSFSMLNQEKKKISF